MSQADLNIDNISRSLFRAEVNQSLQAIASNSSGATEPTTPYQYQFWADTTSGILKQRNGANDAWINKGLLSDVYFGASGGSFTGLVNLNDGDDIASASTVDLTSATGNTVRITGTTAITAFTMNAGQQMFLIADGALPLTYNETTMKINGGASYTCAAGDRLFVTKDQDNIVHVNVIKQDGTAVSGSDSSAKIFDIDASVAGNDLTITVNPFTADFRSGTLTNGTPNSRTLAAAASCVVLSGATLGTVNGQPSRIAILAIDNAGTIEVAVCNEDGSQVLNEQGVISTTALSAAADSDSVIYSTTARSNVPYRVVGYIESTQATAGTWVSAPTLVQGLGGRADISRIYNAVSIALSGVSVDFTNIPSWVKRITIGIDGVSTNGTSDVILQLGDSGGIENTGYLGSTGETANTGSNTTSFTTGVGLSRGTTAATVRHGVIVLVNTGGNSWSIGVSTSRSDATVAYSGGSSKTLSAKLDRLRFTTVAGADTFDAGNANILFE